MAEQTKIVWPVPLILFTVTHLVIIGVTYGTLTSEMKNFNSSLNQVIIELKATNSTVIELKENDIRLKLQHEYAVKRLEALEKGKK